MKWYQNLKISAKLLSAFILISVVTAAVGIFGIQNSNRLAGSIGHMYANNTLPILYLGQADIGFLNLRVDARDYVIATNKADKATFQAAMQDDTQQFLAGMTSYQGAALDAFERQTVASYPSQYQQYQTDLGADIQLDQSGHAAAALANVMGPAETAAGGIDQMLKTLMQHSSASAKASSMSDHTMAVNSRNTAILVIILAFAVSVVGGFVLSRMISRPLNRMVTLVAKVAEGDMRETSDITTNDEVGQLARSVNRMILQLRKIVGEILNSAHSVSSASEQISASIQEIASGNTSQAAASQTMSEMFTQLSSAVQSVARRAEEAAGLSVDTTRIATEGGAVVSASIVGMNGVSGHMAQLNDDSNRVGEIVEVIDDIADQTNLLALNAAIEAARAGEQGRGFAVVADEVRKLAERTGEATKQITAIIKTMQQNTSRSVHAVEESSVLTQRTGDAFQAIIEMVTQTSDKVSDIAAASEEQAAQSTEVQVSVESISAATEQAAASSEETAAASQSLSQLAQELTHLVSIFKVS